VSLADAYDAMTSSRAYRAALPTEIAIEELKFFSGTQFDAALVSVFIENELYLL
jgi:putative two-component system response regulator